MRVALLAEKCSLPPLVRQSRHREVYGSVLSSRHWQNYQPCVTKDERNSNRLFGASIFLPGITALSWKSHVRLAGRRSRPPTSTSPLTWPFAAPAAIFRLSAIIGMDFRTAREDFAASMNNYNRQEKSSGSKAIAALLSDPC
jgi:hypothetical protein